MTATDTIAAIATAHGHGALGVVRASGPTVRKILLALVGEIPPARVARHRAIRNADGEMIDSGLVLYFPGPASFTGEDLCEFHTPGNPLVMQDLLQEMCRLGARLARTTSARRRDGIAEAAHRAKKEAREEVGHRPGALASTHRRRQRLGGRRHFRHFDR